MDGNAKHDIEQNAQTTLRMSKWSAIVGFTGLSKIVAFGYRFFKKRFSSSLNALKKDGPSEDISTTAPLTPDETKKFITLAREKKILIGIQRMNPDDETSKNYSIHKQQKLAKYEIKLKQWQKRDKLLSKIPLLNKISSWQIRSNEEKSANKNLLQKDDRYTILFNHSKTADIYEILQKVFNDRITKHHNNSLEDINQDGVVDDKDIESLQIRSIKTPDELEKIGEDYGTAFVKDYKHNYCTQTITKEDYCAIRQNLLHLKSHGAVVISDTEVLISINSDDLTEYRQYAPIDRSIQEFGSGGARTIQSESNQNDLIELEISDQREFKKFREKYDGNNKDYLAEHHPNTGKVTVVVRETDTKEMAEKIKKKSPTTNDLIQESNKILEHQQEESTTKENNKDSIVETLKEEREDKDLDR